MSNKSLLNETLKTLERRMTIYSTFPHFCRSFFPPQCLFASVDGTQEAAFSFEPGHLGVVRHNLGKAPDKNRMYFITKVNCEVFKNIFVIDFIVTSKGYM